MIYLTDVAGLSAGIVGTLIMITKIFDGLDDVLMGTLVDRTRTKWGRAKPWLVGSSLPAAILLIILFSIPSNISETGKYACVFILYFMLMDFAFSTLQIAGNSLIAFMTKDEKERVDVSVLLYLMGMVTSLVICVVTVPLINAFGGGAIGYRTTIIIYAVVILVLLAFTAFTVKKETVVKQC